MERSWEKCMRATSYPTTNGASFRQSTQAAHELHASLSLSSTRRHPNMVLYLSCKNFPSLPLLTWLPSYLLAVLVTMSHAIADFESLCPQGKKLASFPKTREDELDELEVAHVSAANDLLANLCTASWKCYTPATSQFHLASSRRSFLITSWVKKAPPMSKSSTWALLFQSAMVKLQQRGAPLLYMRFPDPGTTFPQKRLNKAEPDILSSPFKVRSALSVNHDIQSLEKNANSFACNVNCPGPSS